MQTSPTNEHARDENTLFKVYDALREDVALTEKQVRACIAALQKKGIVFFERIEAVEKKVGAVYRGTQDADVPVPQPAPQETTLPGPDDSADNVRPVS